MATEKKIASEADVIENQKAEIELLRAKLEAAERGDNVMTIRTNPESAGDLIRTGEHPEREDTVVITEADNLRREVARQKLYGMDPAAQLAIAKAIDTEEVEETQKD